MANFNKVILLGNLTRDPVLKYLPSGAAVCEIGLAVNRSWNDANSGEKRESTTFVDCRSFGKQAEVLNQYLKKGRQLMIEGRLEYKTWDGKDGQKRSKLDVFIESFQFVGSGRREDEGAPGGAPQAKAPFRGRPAGPQGAPASAEHSDDATGGYSGSSEGPADEDVPF